MASLVSLIERSIKRDTSLEVVGLTSEEEPNASPDGSKNPTSRSTFSLVLLGNVVSGVLSVIFQLSVSSSSEKLAMPPFPSVVPSLVVGASVCVVVAWLKIPTKGEVSARVRGEVGLAVGVVGGVTAVEVKGTAAVVGAGVSVSDGCVVVVAAARTVGGKGVRFLAGGGMVGVGGLNLTMEKHKCTKRGQEGDKNKKSRGRQN